MSSHCNRSGRGVIRALCLGLALAAALPIAAGPAHAEPDRKQRQAAALALYRKGRIQYDLGNFGQAIALFKRAYETSPHESFLFNIAQSYRLMDDCKSALFFYKRYLSVAGGDGKSSDLGRRYIQELSARCAEEEPGPAGPGGDPGSDPGNGGGRGPADGPGRAPGDGRHGAQHRRGAGTGGPGGTGAPGTVAPVRGRAAARHGIEHMEGRARRDSILDGALEMGPAFLDLGGVKPDGAQVSLRVGVGYPMDLGGLDLSVGGLFTHTPVPWVNADAETSGTASLSSLLFNLVARVWLLDRLAVRGELGAGALFLGQLEQGNVFVPPGTMATGALSMVNLRAGIGAELLLTRTLVLSASPAVYSYSPAKQGLRPEIHGVARFEIMAGIGYRL